MATSQVNSAATSTVLLANNSQRKRLMIENTDTNRLHVLLNSGTASTTAYSFSLATNASMTVEGYTGQVVGIWAADGAGAAMITEW